MPKREDIKTICVLGAGPIVIGQACEFDYSGTQACKALRAEGYRVVLVNSNPATIMTDPSMADRTYVEPLVPSVVEEILRKERPEALLPTLGGQTALNLALDLHESGVLEELGVELLGAKADSIELAENRQKFKALVDSLGLESARSGIAHTLEEARALVEYTGLPCVLRPSFTLGGVGAGVVERAEDFDEMVQWALEQSPVSEVLIEESLLGWKEFEVEVMRDNADRVVIICSIENLDPMGVHTGDSITVAPAQTLTDREYQAMRDASIEIIRGVGVETGGSNIQFSFDPRSGRMVVIEMNPRVSRSSALASKATGFPIAKIAALLAVGYTLDELPNDITKTTSACFEPTLDYVVVKIPRFAFEKFPGSRDVLSTQMKSVGEVMAIGRTFGESLQKAVRGLEWGDGTLLAPPSVSQRGSESLLETIARGHSGRLWEIMELLRRGISAAVVSQHSGVEPWFLYEMEELIELEQQLRSAEPAAVLAGEGLEEYKRAGFSDRAIAKVLGVEESDVRAARERAGVIPVYKRVDTCAAEFEALTPYMYSTYEQECESEPDDRSRVLILGSGPNRIGQGIEFDYSCVKAAWAAGEMGHVTIMLNCNPETVSTDHDTSDRLYFEPVDLEGVLEVVRLERPTGVIVQLGGQTPLRLARALEEAGVPIVGTPPSVIDRAEDRAEFVAFADELGLQLPSYGTARSREEAFSQAERLGYPLMVRPSHVLGGRAMEVLRDGEQLESYLARFFVEEIDERALPLLFDAFLEGAIEVDVDGVCDGEQVLIGGVMEQVEPVGVHSGDSACWLPGARLSEEVVEELRRQTTAIALGLGVVGLLNVQYAVLDGADAQSVYVIEVNPRASRTVPFVSKAVGVCLTEVATQVMLGRSLEEQGLEGELHPRGVFCKEVVLPLSRFAGASPVLRPEMRSTGEVMARAEDVDASFARAQLAADNAPTGERLYVDVGEAMVEVFRDLKGSLEGFTLFADAEACERLSDCVRLPVQALEAGVELGEQVDAGLILHQESSVALSKRFRRVLAAQLPYFSTAQSWGAWVRGRLARVEVCALQDL